MNRIENQILEQNLLIIEVIIGIIIGKTIALEITIDLEAIPKCLFTNALTEHVNVFIRCKP